MIRKARFLAFREKFSDPILTGLTAVLLLLLFVVAPLQATFGVAFEAVGVAIVLVMVAGVYVLSGRWIVLIPLALGVALHLALVRLRGDGDAPQPHLYLLASLWLTLSLTFAVVVARAVFAEGRVTTHRLIGAVLLYMLVALIFVSLYLFIGTAFPGAFDNLAIAESPRLVADMVYFSFTTLTSVGYGEIFPVHPVARSLCNLESICGQLYPAVLLARLVSLHVEQRK